MLTRFIQVTILYNRIIILLQKLSVSNLSLSAKEILLFSQNEKNISITEIKYLEDEEYYYARKEISYTQFIF